MSLSDFLAADLDTMLKDFGVPVVFGSQSTLGILDVEEERVRDQTGERLWLDERTLTMRNGSLTDLATDSVITIDGAPFVVHRPVPHADANELRLLVSPVS